MTIYAFMATLKVSPRHLLCWDPLLIQSAGVGGAREAKSFFLFSTKEELLAGAQSVQDNNHLQRLGVLITYL